MKKITSHSFVAIALLLSTVALALSTTAYSQSPNPLYQHLPPSASHIYSVRLGQIIAKGELAGLLGSIPMKDPKSEDFIKILQDPASAGVDLNHEILIAQTTATGKGADTLSFTQILVPLTDSAKFRSVFVAKLNQRVHRVPGKGATTYKAKEGMAWNDQLLVITEASSPVGEKAVEKSLAALAGFSGTPWLTDQRFLTGFATDEDMHAWSQKMDFMQLMSKLIKKMAAKNPAMQNAPFPDYSNMGQMPHPPVLSTFNFDNGRIVFRMTTFNKPEDVAMYKREFDRPINKDLLARVPGGGVLLGFAAMHFNAAALPDVLDKYHTRHMLDSVLGKSGLSVNDVSSIFGGDFLVAALADTTATTDTVKKKVNVYFVMTLGDPAKLMQLTATLAGASNGSADTAKVAMLKKLADKLVIRDNTLVISGSREMAQKYFDNQSRRATDLIDDKSVQELVVDLKAVSAFIGTSMTNDPKAMIIARVLEKLDKIELKSSLGDGDNMVVTFQIITGDSSTNSLKTLVGLLH
jgi:Domain of unknown function (DUF4836)